jgi:hypothetical protein
VAAPGVDGSEKELVVLGVGNAMSTTEPVERPQDMDSEASAWSAPLLRDAVGSWRAGGDLE